jgi:CRP-like cAMP-binding protein
MPTIGTPKDLLHPAKGGAGGAAPAKPAAAAPDTSLVVRAGDILFQQGDPGGDLYFIESGTVEIFTHKDNQEIALDEMTKGEILGVMTCLTSEPRMATARAKTDLVCKKVPHANIKKVLAALPNWMKIVLKEFTVRLGNMNRQYSEAHVKIKELEQYQLSHVHQGALLAAAFGTFAEYIAKTVADVKIVIVEDMMTKLEPLLNIRREDLDRLFAVLLEAGLVRLEIEPEKKVTIVKLDQAQKLAHFAAFVRDSKHGPTKKLIRARFANRETRVMAAMVKLAQRLKMELEKTVKIPVAELESSLERATGVKFERDALDKGAALKLLAIEGGSRGAMVVFRPGHLGRTVACIEAVRKLAALDEAGPFGKRSGREAA